MKKVMLAALLGIGMTSCDQEKPTIKVSPTAEILSGMPKLYLAKDSLILNTTCNMVERDFTNCKGEADTYTTYLPGSELSHIKVVDGKPLSPEEILSFVNCKSVMDVIGKDSKEPETKDGHVVDPERSFWDTSFGETLLDIIKGLILIALAILLGVLLWGLIRRALNWASSPLATNGDGGGGSTTSGKPIQPVNQLTMVPEGMVLIPVGGTYLPPLAEGRKRRVRIEERPTAPPKG